jgi:hypothetical protein
MSSDRPLMGLNRGWRQWVPKSLDFRFFLYLYVLFVGLVFSLCLSASLMIVMIPSFYISHKNECLLI